MPGHPAATSGLLQAPGEPSSDGRRAFLRTVSHELRTPLNAIIGFSDILSCELYGPLGSSEYREYADIIRNSGLKLLRLVNDILELARLEGGAADLLVREESLRQSLDEAVLTVGPEAGVRGVSLHVNHPDGLPAVLGDARGLHTILVNLLQHAIAASPAGTEVSVRAGCCGERVFVEVLDACGGIEPEALARLADPFDQVSEETAGPDLSLPIARLLTQALGGAFALETLPGRGVLARVSLRLADAPAGPVLLRA